MRLNWIWLSSRSSPILGVYLCDANGLILGSKVVVGMDVLL